MSLRGSSTASVRAREDGGGRVVGRPQATTSPDLISKDGRLFDVDLPTARARACARRACIPPPGDRPRPGFDPALGWHELGSSAATDGRPKARRRVGLRHAVSERA